MRYYNSYTNLVGKTPLIKLNNMGFSKNLNVFAKMELMNPGGSVKDRMGVSMIEEAVKSGKLKKGGTVLEVTAGGAGIGIAMACIGKGYRVVFIVPTKFSQEKQDIMRILGAEVINTPKELGMQGAFDLAEKMLKEDPNIVYLSQFSNPANTKAHFETTGPEIYEDLDGDVDYIINGAGSGGTLSGIAKYFKSRNSKAKIIMVDPIGSTMGGGAAGHYAIEGIGNTFMPETMDMSLVDEVFKVKDEEAIEEVNILAKQEGILAGTSSGANLSVLRKLDKRGIKGNVVLIFSDRGDRYLSKGIYSVKNS